MRPGVTVLVAALLLAAAAPLHADEWTLIDVKAHIANDARVTVVETHDIVLEHTGRNTFRTFGLGADQAIRLTAIARIGPDGETHRLKAVETVSGPDEYRYYDRGHVYFSIPPLGDGVVLQYRFEYELAGAVTPAWAIAAGPGSRASDEQEFFWPWARIGHVVADWRRAWPALTTRYRFDHDVLLPSREGPGYVFRQIDYRLEYDSAWRDIAPAEDVGAATHGAYRTHKVFDYLGPGIPAQATTAQALMRLASLAAPPIAGALGWLLVIGAARLRRDPPIDRTFVETRILTRAPEEIAFWIEGTRPAAADVLARLAGEAAISIQVDAPAGQGDDADEDAPMRLQMRRVAPDASLTAFERDILDDIFGNARELTTASHQQRHAGRDYDPDAVVERRLEQGTQGGDGASKGAAKAAGTRWSPARIGLVLVFVAALVNVFRYAGPLIDVMPVLGIWAFVTVTLVTGWPAGWWYPGRPVSGLLVPLVVLVPMQLTLLLVPNRPLPAEGWAASAIVVLAGYFLMLLRCRVPAGRGGGVVGDLLRMRAYAQAELKRPRPQLDDRWIPRLRALGLGPAIEAWRARQRGGGGSAPELDDRPLITSAYFSGMSPPPWVGPTGWADALSIYADDEDDEGADDDGDDDDEDDEDADDDGNQGKDRS